MKRYCVIGKSLPHTLSPAIHRALGCSDYGICELPDEIALSEFVKKGEYDGYNVTIPYKQAIIPMLDEVSDDALAIGAVNTVVMRGGKSIGYNTDIDGMRLAMQKVGISVCGKTVLILGSGGTSHTARRLCAIDGAKSVYIVSRSGEINYQNCYDLPAQVIINTTPVGMMPNSYAAPVDIERFSQLEGVFDCIYNPLETLLVKNAKAHGIKAANGLLMLVEQARAAHDLYEGTSTPASVSEKIEKNIAKEMQNVVLIGMAGSGKSTIGKLLAEKLGKEFFDSDEEIVKEQEMSIPEIFAKYGESGFRKMEESVIERLCSKQGAIIATGGGAVLSDKNKFFLKANGVCVLVERDVDALATDGRPLSGSISEAKKLFEKREPIYRALADISVKNDRSVQEATDFVLAKLIEW